jgi:predicted nucleic acid-binding protein
MIVLDTNVLSEPLKQQPDPQVLAWLASADEEAGVTSVSVGELLTGVRALPTGRRRAGLLDAIESTLRVFAGSVLPYDEAAARQYARLQEVRRAAGRPLAVEDGMIAAICIARGMRLATRNTSDFDGLGLELFDPWSPC